MIPGLSMGPCRRLDVFRDVHLRFSLGLREMLLVNDLGGFLGEEALGQVQDIAAPVPRAAQNLRDSEKGAAALLERRRDRPAPLERDRIDDKV